MVAMNAESDPVAQVRIVKEVASPSTSLRAGSSSLGAGSSSLKVSLTGGFILSPWLLV